jgi:hypothetical protein
MDAFDRFWQWGNKPPESLLSIPCQPPSVMELALKDRRDREKVNAAFEASRR